MAVARYQLPDGRIARFKVPDGTTEEQANQMISGFDFSSIPQKDSGSSFIGSVKRGALDTAALVGDALPGLIGSGLGFDEYGKRNMAEAAAAMQEASQLYPAKFNSIDDVNSLGDFGSYATEAIGESVSSIVPSLLTGGIGGFVGKAAVKGATEAALKKAAASGIGEELAKQTALKAGAREATKYQAAGALAGSAAQNIPDTGMQIYNETGEIEPGLSFVTGTAKGALDAFLPTKLLRSGSATGSALQRGATGLATGIGIEGGTEGTQSLMDSAALAYLDDEKNPFFSEKTLRQARDAAIAGGIGGGVISGVSDMAFGSRDGREANLSPLPSPTAPPRDDIGVGRSGKYTYEGEQFEGTIVGYGPNGLPIFDTAGTPRQVQPEDIIEMYQPQQEQSEQGLLTGPDTTMYASSQGVGTASAMDALRRQAAAFSPPPLAAEERQPAAGAQYDLLQRQLAQYQQLEADRRAAAEDAELRRIEQQNKEALELKRQSDAEFLANEQLASKVSKTRLSNTVDTPRLTYDNTLSVTPQGVALPRSQVVQQAADKKLAMREAQQKRIDDGYDPAIEPPAQVIDRAPLPADPVPPTPVAPKPLPEFNAGELVKNRYADYTKPLQQQLRWIEGTIAELNDTSGGQRVFVEADRQGSTPTVTGGKGNTPAWFTNYNKAAVQAQKSRKKVGAKNAVTEDSKKAELEYVPQILTRQKASEVAAKMLAGKPIGKAEARIAKTLYDVAAGQREESIRQMQDVRDNRNRVNEDEMGDAYEPILPPRDTSADDIPFDIPADKPVPAVRRFKGETGINRVAAERNAVTSKVVESSGYFDPLTESKYFPEDAEVAPEALDNEPPSKPSNKQWKKEKIEITLDDGTKEKVAAGDMAKNLKKMADSLQKLKACLG